MVKLPQKALFITNDTSVYGASKSLQTLLRHYSGVEIDLVVNRRLVRKNNIHDIREHYGPNIVKVMEFYLPYDPCYKGKDPNMALILAGRLQWERNKRAFYRMIENENYDFIHLNSLVLHRIIDQRFPFFLHVREIYDGSSPSVFASLRRAKGVIFIDETTMKSIPEECLPQHIVLNNPFYMCSPSPNGLQEVEHEDKTVFSIIGTVIENKGVDFVIKAFKEVTNQNNLLLIVGRGEPKYLQHCVALADGDPRIIFYGEEPEISKIYAISDYIIRGEAYPCIGRTIYEGLYAGCQVLVPGSEANEVMFFDYSLFQDKIFFYKPRNTSALADLMRNRTGKKVVSRTLRSNIKSHIERFNHFISDTLY